MSKINIGQLLIEIGLKDSFSKELSRLNKDIKGLEKNIKGLDKEFANYAKTTDGLAEKQKMLSEIIEKSQTKQIKLTEKRDAIIEKYQKELSELEKIEQQYGKNSEKYNDQARKMLDSVSQLNRVNSQLDTATKFTRKYQAQLEEVTQEYHKLSNGIQSYDEKLESIKNNTSELVDELELEEKVLNSQKKVWKAYDNAIQQTALKLESSKELYKTHREELTRLSQEEERVTKLKEENLKVLAEEEIRLEELKKTHGEISTEYQNQSRYVEELKNNKREYVEILSSISTQQERVTESMRQSRKEVVENSIAMREFGNTKIEQTLNKTANTLTHYGESMQGASVASGVFAGTSATLFMQYEQGVAKIETLLQGDVGQLDKISKECIRISNETGQAIGTVLEGSYTALSSGIKPNELVSFMETASKMATSAQTTTENTVRLLSQTSNTYGSSALGGDVKKISDFYTAVQDLGVASIEELSNSMSESLSLGSAFGVQFEDLGASIVKATLNGQSCSEATTDLSRLLEELADNGSEVGQILKDKTGKSFTELTKEGKHLDEILGIIAEEANASGVELNSLFGSSNAGMMALNILSKEGGTFAEILAQLGNSSGLTDKNFKILSETAQFKLSSALNELKNSLVDIGGAFAPVIDVVSKVISGIAKGINALPSPIKNVIGLITGLTATISPALIGIGKFASGIADVVGDVMDIGLFDNLFNEGKITKKAKSTKDLLVKSFTIDTKDLNKSNSTMDAFVKQQADRMQEQFKNGKFEIEVTPTVDTSEIKKGTETATKTIASMGKSASGATSIFSKLWGVMSAHPIATVAVAVGTLVTAWQAYKYIQEKNSNKGIKAMEEATKKVEEHRAKIKELESTQSTLKSLGDEWETLSKKTNKTAEEQKRMNEIAKELEKIDPSLVSYDSNGQLQVDIDKVRELTREVERLTEAEKRRENQGMRDQAYSAKQALTDEWNKKGGWGDQDKKNEQTANNLKSTLSANWYSAETEEQRKKQMENWAKQIEMYHDLKEQEQQAIEEYTNAKWDTSDTTKEFISNQLDLKGVFEGRTEEVKGYCDNFMNALDFSDLDKTQIRSVSADLQNFFKTASDADIEKAKQIGDSVQTITDQFMSGDISSEEYQKAINGYVDSLHELTGIDKETLKQMLQLPEVDATNLLKSTDDVLDAKAKISEALYDIANEDDMEIRMQMAMDILNDESIPRELRNKVAEIIADGEITDQEVETLIELNGEIEDKDLKDTVNKELEGLSEEKEVTMDVALSYATKVKNGADFADYLNEITGDKELSVEIQTAIATGDFDTFNKKLKDMPKEKQIGIITAMKNSGQYTPEQLEKIIGNLPKETQATIRAEVENGNLPKEMLDYLDKVDGKESTANVKITGDNTEANQKIDETNGKQVNDKNLKVNGDNSNANQKIDETNNKQVPSKTAKINGDNSEANQKIDDTNNKQIPDKEFSVDANDNSTSVLTGIKGWLDSIKSKVITVTTRKIMTGGSGGSIWDKSVNAPRIAEDIVVKSNISAPRIVDNLTSDLTAIDNNIVSARNSISANMNNVVSAMATVDTYADTGYTIRALQSDVDLLENLNAVINKLTANLNKLEAQQEKTWGNSEVNLLQQQVSLLSEQQRLTKATENNMKNMASALKSSLISKGFKFNSDGSIDNYNTKLISMTENVEKLKKKMDDYKGDSESYKDSLSNAYNKANDELTKVKEQLDQYMDLTFNSIPQAQAEWEDLANSIASAKAEIIQAKHEQQAFYEDVRMEIKEAIIDKYDSMISTIQIKADLSDFQSKMEYMEQEIGVIQQAISEVADLKDTANVKASDLRNLLMSNGFNISSNGDIKDAEGTLKRLKDTLSDAEFDAIKDVYDDYVDTVYSTIPSLEEQWWDYKSSIQDVRNEMEELRKEQEEMQEEMSKIKSQSALTQLQKSYESLNQELELIQAKTENALGKDRVSMLQQQIKLTKELQQSQLVLNQEYAEQVQLLSRDLAKYGIQFDKDGNINNLEKVMNQLEDLEEMEKLQDLVDEYADAISEVADSRVEFENLKSEIKDLQNEMLELNKETREFIYSLQDSKFENNLKSIQNQIDLIDSKLESSNSNQVELLNEKIELYKKLSLESQKSLEYQEEERKRLAKNLSTFGFQIDNDGNVQNATQLLENFKKTMTETEFEYIESMLNDYYDILLDKIPQLEQELIEFEVEQEELQREKLEMVEEIEEEITKVYEKQIEDRIEVIEKEADERIESINKAKDAYEKYRDEVDYNDDYNEQLKLVEDLQKQVEIAKRDTSLNGQKRLQELLEELNEEQKSLQDLVRDKVDSDIQDMFDNEIDRIETDSEEQIKKIEEMWTATNIAGAVQQALQTGIFEDIDGNIKELDNALMEFANTSEDYLGIMGDTLKTELLDNLNEALAVMQEMNKTMSQIDYNSVRFAGQGYDSKAMNGTVNNNTNTINVDFKPSINVQAQGGEIDEEQLVDLITDMKDDMISEIEYSILKNMK